MTKISRRLGILGLCLCIAAGLLALTSNTWLSWIGETLTYSEPPCKADLIVMLAGDFSGRRVDEAAELLKAGWAPEILVSGAGTCYGVNEGDLAIRFAIHQGYPADKFFNLPSPARSTLEESRYVIPELRRRGVHRFLLVTSNYHTRRAAKVYRDNAPDIPFCVVAAPDYDFNPHGWWHTREGRKVAFVEWLKTIANFFGI